LAIQSKDGAIRACLRLVVDEIVTWIHGQQHQIRVVAASQMTPGEKLLASAVSTHAEIQHLNACGVATAQRTTWIGGQTPLHLLCPGCRFIHLKGFGEGITQHRDPQNP
jgi:hypothetical protein